MAGVALGDIHLRFAWQTWHIWHWAGSGGALGAVLVAGDAAALCVWQAWHLWRLAGSGGALGAVLVAGDAAALCVAGVDLVTSAFVSHGRRVTWRHPPSFCVAGVALWALGWFWWRAWAGISHD